jgi:hypothetical protein
MRNRLPVNIENRELPVDEYMINRENNRENSYGYVNILYFSSLIITIASVIAVIMFGR